LPFLVEAVVASFFGSILAVIGLFVSRSVLESSLQDFAGAGLVAPVTTADVWQLAPFVTLIGAALAAATAYITLRWYVRT
jgi:cell division transport system permease protein